MIAIIATLVLLGIVVFGIVKKVNVATTLFFVTIIGYLGLAFVRGTALAGDATVGNAFLDIFELMYVSMKDTIQNTGLIIIMMLGYIEYMNSIKASEMFALLLAAPIQKFKAKYIVAALGILVGVLMGIVLQSSIVIVSLMLATIYPVLRAAGCSKATCGVAMIMPTLVTISPSRASYFMAISALGLENVSVPLWFAQVQLPVGMIETFVIMIVFIITSLYFDKKEHKDEKQENEESRSYKELGVPVYYAILPLLPLILVIIFSSLVMKSIVITAVGATLLSAVISFIVHAITNRSLMVALKGFDGLYEGMGKIMKSMGPILLFGTTFANVLAEIGGMTKLVEFFGNFASGSVLLLIVSIIMMIILALTGSYMGNVALLFPFVSSICTASGIDPVGASTAGLLVMAAGEGFCLIAAPNLMIAEATDTNIMTLVKRAALPSIAAAAAVYITCMLFFF